MTLRHDRPEHPAMSGATPGARPSARRRTGQILLTIVLTISGLVAISTAFSDDPFPRPAVVLIATFGVLAATFGLALVWRTGSGPLVLWALPAFFVIHVAALGTWIPDAALALLAAVGVLLTHHARAGRRSP